MAVDAGTLRLARNLRIELDLAVDQSTRELAKAWARAWNELSGEWADAITDVIAASSTGRWPSRRQIMRLRRVQNAIAVTREALDELGTLAGVQVSGAVPALVEGAAAGEAALMAAQTPVDFRAGFSFDRVDARALDKIVRRTTRRITSQTRTLSPQAQARMRSELIRGVALGKNPRAAATRMVSRLEGGFAGGYARAETIARTELLDAYRGGAHAQDQANTDVLTGWIWDAQLDVNTCPSCWAQDGSEHPLEEEGPIDHQNGRCARLPKVKSWRELGINVEEPPSVKPDARAVFDALPQADRLAVMGPRRLDLLDSGQVGWSDLSQLRTADGWRDSIGVTPLKDLV